MASADLYGACLGFLAGDTGDVRSSVNAEFPSLLATGSVLVSRGGQGSAAREAKTRDVTVELVPTDGEWPSRAIGIGWKEREVVLELRVTARRKGLRPGKTQLDLVEDVARALVARYDQVSNLGLAVPSLLTVLVYTSWANGQSIVVTANGTPYAFSPGANWTSGGWSSNAAVASELASLMTGVVPAGVFFSGSVPPAGLIVATVAGAVVMIGPGLGTTSFVVTRTPGGANEPVASLAIPATWRRSSCRLLRVDDVPESGEYARSVAELRLVFTEPLASN